MKQMVVSGSQRLEMTEEEYDALSRFLEPLGVELRTVSWDGRTKLYNIEGRNALLDWCRIAPHFTAKEALQKSREDIEKGRWRL